MSSFLLYGKFTPDFWSRIRNEDPAVAENEIQTESNRLDCKLIHFFFALGEFDFYAVFESSSSASFNTVRHKLMSRGSYSRLHCEPLFTYGELFPMP